MTRKSIPRKREKVNEVRWVVIGERGLYVGQWLLKRDAIATHISEKGVPWRRCRKLGDRVVKARITFERTV